MHHISLSTTITTASGPAKFLESSYLASQEVKLPMGLRPQVGCPALDLKLTFFFRTAWEERDN